MKPAITEIDVIRDIRNGNNDAFNLLVSKYQKHVYYLAYGIIYNHHLAEEISQETFIRLWKSLKSGRFDENRSLYPWIRTICVNLTRDFLKNKKRQTRLMTEMALQEKDCTYEPEPTSNDKMEKIGRALESLPPDKREVLTLRLVEDLSYKEISEQLNCSIGTVMSRLFRARLELKAKLSFGAGSL